MHVASAKVTGSAACSAVAISAMHWASPQGNRSLAGLMSIDTDFSSVAGDSFKANLQLKRSRSAMQSAAYLPARSWIAA